MLPAGQDWGPESKWAPRSQASPKTRHLSMNYGCITAIFAEEWLKIVMLLPAMTAQQLCMSVDLLKYQTTDCIFIIRLGRSEPQRWQPVMTQCRVGIPLDPCLTSFMVTPTKIWQSYERPQHIHVIQSRGHVCLAWHHFETRVSSRVERLIIQWSKAASDCCCIAMKTRIWRDW